VTDLEVAIIRQAEFNVPIDTTEFRIPFQEGTVFADHRADRDQFAPATKTWKASVGGDDALDAADHPQNYRKMDAGTPVSGTVARQRWGWVIAVNLVATALIYLGIRMARRAASRM
jgi:hypothetical protein